MFKTRIFAGAALAIAIIANAAAHAQYTAKEWPDGPMKQRFVSICGGCHDINRVRVGYTPEGWLTVTRMMQNMAAPEPAEEWPAMTEYLIKSFPERARPAAAILPGPVKVNIKMWDVPTLGSRPHDPRAAKDGSIWWTGQLVNKLGRLDPKSGAIKLITSPTPNSRPYGLMIDSKGTPWIAEFGAPKIARIDPQAMQFKEFTLPSPAARPRRLAVTDDNTIWYTDFARGYLGRLDVKTGEVKEWPSPSGPKSEPYGIVFTKGALWYAETAAKPNTIVRFDPKTGHFQSWAIPGGGDIVRNMDVTRDGNPVFADSLTNQVGLVEVAQEHAASTQH